MSSDELKEKTFYHVETPFIKGRFEYLGTVDHNGNRKYLFQHFGVDVYLSEDEIMWYVNGDKDEF